MSNTTDSVDPKTIRVGVDTLDILARRVERKRLIAAAAGETFHRIEAELREASRLHLAANREVAEAIADEAHAREQVTSLIDRYRVADDPDIAIVECAECGHLHYVTAFKVFIDCPLAPDCACEGQR